MWSTGCWQTPCANKKLTGLLQLMTQFIMTLKAFFNWWKCYCSNHFGHHCTWTTPPSSHNSFWAGLRSSHSEALYSKHVCLHHPAPLTWSKPKPSIHLPDATPHSEPLSLFDHSHHYVFSPCSLPHSPHPEQLHPSVALSMQECTRPPFLLTSPLLHCSQQSALHSLYHCCWFHEINLQYYNAT